MELQTWFHFPKVNVAQCNSRHKMAAEGGGPWENQSEGGSEAAALFGQVSLDITVVSIFFSIIPIQPQYIPYIPYII